MTFLGIECFFSFFLFAKERSKWFQQGKYMFWVSRLPGKVREGNFAGHRNGCQVRTTVCVWGADLV